jgi:hypothetical protein
MSQNKGKFLQFLSQNKGRFPSDNELKALNQLLQKMQQLETVQTDKILNNRTLNKKTILYLS